MRALFEPTPLQRNVYLSEKFDADIWLKREDLTPVRSYKIRGAFNAMRKSLEAEPDRRLFICASAGNHAQGVAFACRHFGVDGVIFMPVTTPGQKTMKTRAFGGGHVEICLTGDYFDDTLRAAQLYASEKGGVFLPPFDALDIIEGQASVAVELEEQLERLPDLIVLPVGGGGLSAGMTQYMPNTDFVFVEPKGAASLKSALELKTPVLLNRVDNFVDGASVAKIGEHNFEALKRFEPEDVVTVAEDRICATMVDMLNVEGVVLEPAGALAIDALKDLGERVKGNTVVLLVSGGNFDFERLPDVKERAMRHEGLKKYFVLRLPQRPGALRDFLEMLGPSDDIARFEYLKKSARNFGSVLIGIETTDPLNFSTLFAKLEESGFLYEDITDNEILGSLVI
jgi:threonine dehydratase